MASNSTEPTTELTTEQAQSTKKVNLGRTLIYYATMILVFAFMFFNFKLMTVPTGSMYPTLQVHECLAVKTISNHRRTTRSSCKEADWQAWRHYRGSTLPRYSKW